MVCILSSLRIFLHGFEAGVWKSILMAIENWLLAIYYIYPIRLKNCNTYALSVMGKKSYDNIFAFMHSIVIVYVFQARLNSVHIVIR